MMYEKHDTEQYFFDGPTLDHLANFVSSFDNPCCLCAPLLGKMVVERGYHVRILDVDDRFARVPGFILYDIYRPKWLGETFDLIVCDPPSTMCRCRSCLAPFARSRGMTTLSPY